MEAANAAAAREARAREAIAVLTASGAGADGAALLAAGLAAANVTETEVEKIPFIDLNVHLDFDRPVHVWIDCLTGIVTPDDDAERFLFLMEPEAITGVAAQLVTKNLVGRFRAIFTHDAELLRTLPRARRFEHGGTWGHSRKKAIRPTTGMVSVMVALHLCERTNLFGFSWGSGDRRERAHYYAMLPPYNRDGHLADTYHDPRAEFSLLRRRTRSIGCWGPRFCHESVDVFRVTETHRRPSSSSSSSACYYWQ